MTTSSAPDPGERVALAVSLVPPGRVAAYGEIGTLVGIGPRQVGAVLKDLDLAVPWWRIVGHDGRCAVLDAALPHWRAEGIEVRPDGRGCRMARYHVDLGELATDYRLAAAERGWSFDEP